MITVLMQIWCYSADIYITFNAALPQGVKNENAQHAKLDRNFCELMRLFFDNTIFSKKIVDSVPWGRIKLLNMK